jgi:ABC-type antimicrobial peptide transport system permease subunit
MAPGASITSYWLTDRIGNTTAIRNPRFQTIVLSSFAGIAVLLTAVGVFAVVAFLVVARRREMGVRIAIGANPQRLTWLLVKQALAPVAIGLILGLLATRWLAGFAESQLYAVNTNDPATLTGTVVTVLIASLAAAYLPARRASRVDPIVVLRAE